jgi:hypothetical protein
LSGVFTAAGLTPRVHESEELGATVVTGTANPGSHVPASADVYRV